MRGLAVQGGCGRGTLEKGPYSKKSRGLQASKLNEWTMHIGTRGPKVAATMLALREGRTGWALWGLQFTPESAGLKGEKCSALALPTNRTAMAAALLNVAQCPPLVSRGMWWLKAVCSVCVMMQSEAHFLLPREGGAGQQADLQKSTS